MRPSYDRATDDEGEILPATHGSFSTPFYRRAKGGLDVMPELIGHIVALHTARCGASDDRVHTTKELPLPFSMQAWDDANEVYALGVEWVGTFSRALKAPAPGPAARAWRNEWDEVVGLPPHVEPHEAREVTATMSTWLSQHLDRILGHDPAQALRFSEALRTIYRINARWPRHEPTSWSRLPCPKDQSRIGIYPPDHLAGDKRYVCEAGHIMSQEEYEGAVADLVTALRTAQHLSRKYAQVGK